MINPGAQTGLAANDSAQTSFELNATAPLRTKESDDTVLLDVPSGIGQQQVYLPMVMRK